MAAWHEVARRRHVGTCAVCYQRITLLRSGFVAQHRAAPGSSTVCAGSYSYPATRRRK